jgi:hypothetical protein
VVNNYIVGNNNTIINNGISRDFVRNQAGSELPRVRVAEASPAVGRAVQPDRPVRVGAETVVYRPQRPAPTLVRAHEEAVARSRSEVARPAGGSPSVAGAIPSRGERPQTVSPASPTAGPASRRELGESNPRGTASIARGETARPQIAARNQGPVFGTPAPVRPEPDRSAEILRSRSRTTQEAVVRPNVSPSSSLDRGAVSSRPGGETITVRPATPGSSIAPRLRPNSETASPSGRASGRPGITPLPAQQTPMVGAETARPTGPARQPVASSPGFSRPRTEPARSPDLAQPQTQVARPGTITQTTPSVSRPAPTAVQPVTPTVRSAPRAQPQGNVSISPQPIQRSAPSSQAPMSTRPSVAPRPESFSRPSGAIRSSPAPNVVRPQPVAPSVSRPQMSSPSVSAPPQRSSPSVSSSSRPINGGSFRSAPPASASAPSVSRPSPAPAQSTPRPSAPSGSSGGGGRGRVEVGR